jgi:GNAT superfamily N-acetyltransferase
MDPFSSPQVVCRPALPSDAADVLEFTKSIWDGHDYIQYVWQDWLADPRGILAVAEYAGHAVGLGKVTCISPGQWWLEGLRVAPKYQGLKIGSHIFEYLEDWWKQYGGGAIRLMTSWERVEVHHLCERFGWAKLGEVRSYSAAGEAGEGDRFEAVRGEDIRHAAEFAAAQLGKFNGLMDSGWQFSAPDEAALREKAEEGRLYWWTAPGQGLMASWEDGDEGENVMGIGFAAVQDKVLKDLLVEARRLAHTLGFARVLWLAPAMSWVEAALTEAGFATDWDGNAYLFGKKDSSAEK